MRDDINKTSACGRFNAPGTMPQNNPMTPERTSCAGCRWDRDGICSNYFPCMDHEWWEMPPAQLIRSTLEAAAERFCKICPGPGCPGKCKAATKSECGYWQIIAQKGEI